MFQSTASYPESSKLHLDLIFNRLGGGKGVGGSNNLWTLPMGLDNADKSKLKGLRQFLQLIIGFLNAYVCSLLFDLPKDCSFVCKSFWQSRLVAVGDREMFV